MYVDNRGRSGCQAVIAVGIAGVAVAAYFVRASINSVTGEKRHIDISAEQEIALGEQVAPELVARYGGEDPDRAARQYVAEIGKEVVSRSQAGKSGYKFQFHDLADEKTVDAFDLPGGQVFITRGLLTKLTSSGQLAAILGHECAHVLARHRAEQFSSLRDAQGKIVPAAGPLIGQLLDVGYGRSDELEADRLGVRLMSEAGFDPRSMIEAMEILKQASKGGHDPAFFSTHPNPDNREDEIRKEIAARFPNGIPFGLTR
ncbi:MAG TPA: M48 family metalloprotease [Fimbriimonadaceae bacterium]|nr:M48 family metalloprotease [Fimbriimonadaceae bacterium]